MILIRLIFISL